MYSTFILVVCGLNILFYSSDSDWFSEKPLFQLRFGFVTCFAALGLSLTHSFEEKVLVSYTSLGLLTTRIVIVIVHEIDSLSDLHNLKLEV